MNEKKTYVTPEVTGLSREEIFKKAEAKAKELGYSPGDSFKKVFEKIDDGKVKFFEEDNEAALGYLSGLIAVDGKGSFTIYLSNLTSYLRNRFTIAHELGHYYLHSKEGERLIRTARNPKISSKVETEANYFAAAFLMPSEKFNELDKKYNKDDDAMAAEFLVSQSAINVRRKSLKK